MQRPKYGLFVYCDYRLLTKVQYSGDQIYVCQSQKGCGSLQNPPSFGTVKVHFMFQKYGN